jgi:hypothetical protein
MNYTKIAAAAAVLLALVLVAVGVSILGSGPQGYFGIVGLIAIAGAVVLLAAATRLYSRAATSDVRRSVRVRFSRGQRLGLLALGVLFLSMGAKDVVTGTTKSSNKSRISKQSDPGAFWQRVLLQAGTGALLVFLGLRGQAGSGTSRDKSRQRFDSSGGVCRLEDRRQERRNRTGAGSCLRRLRNRGA